MRSFIQSERSQLYSQFAQSLLSYIVGCAGTATRIDVVFDVYKENSIKDVERARRSTGSIVLKRIISSAPIKQLGDLLSSRSFKNMLNRFLADEWKRSGSVIGNKVLYVTSARQTMMILADSNQIVPELESDHEEADTRMLLHAAHANSIYNEIVISTPDTDVFMIALAKLDEIDANLFFHTGTKDKRRIIDLNAVSGDANERFNETNLASAMFMKALLGFHGFTGCD